MTNPTDGAMPPLPEPLAFELPWSLICKWSDMQPGPGAGFVADQIDEALRVYAINYAKAYAAPLVARVAELQAALELVLPMAKGYARVHNVGSNQAYCDQADAALTSNKEQQP